MELSCKLHRARLFCNEGEGFCEVRAEAVRTFYILYMPACKPAKKCVAERDTTIVTAEVMVLETTRIMMFQSPIKLLCVSGTAIVAPYGSRFV